MSALPIGWLLASAFVSGVGAGVALIGLIDWLERRRQS